MSSLVLVAIPEADEQVWEVSSEKIPHMTLLFLGENSANANVLQIAQFLQHAASLLSPFWMDVDRRDTLGADEADVLFFSKSWDTKRVNEFRSGLLMNDAIQAAYASVEQFPEWLPHLTLGYPTAPAKKLKNNSVPRFYSVKFDRVALWLGDSEGPSFRLENKNLDYEEGAMAMSDVDKIAEDLVLQHFGRKGMKWGVRNPEKKAARQEKNYVKSVGSVNTAVLVHNGAAAHFNARVGALNDRHTFTNDDFKNNTPVYQAYTRDAAKMSKEAVESAVARLPKSPSGTKKVGLTYNNDSSWNLHVEEVKHALGDTNTIRVTPVLAANGRIKSIKMTDVEEVTLSQGEQFVDGLLHFGVKGMKWGKRRAREDVSTTEKTTAIRGKTKVVAKGGTLQPAAKDAIDVASSKRVLKKSGPAALSNKELADVARRMQLEKQVTELTAPKGKKFVTSLLRQSGQQQAQKAANDYASKQVSEMMKEKKAAAK